MCAIGLTKTWEHLHGTWQPSVSCFIGYVSLSHRNGRALALVCSASQPDMSPLSAMLISASRCAERRVVAEAQELDSSQKVTSSRAVTFNFSTFCLFSD
jgi:hypothetical protein